MKVDGGKRKFSLWLEPPQLNKLFSTNGSFKFRSEQGNQPPSLSILPTATPHLAEATRSQRGLRAALDCPLLHPVTTIA